MESWNLKISENTLLQDQNLKNLSSDGHTIRCLFEDEFCEQTTKKILYLFRFLRQKWTHFFKLKVLLIIAGLTYSPLFVGKERKFSDSQNKSSKFSGFHSLHSNANRKRSQTIIQEFIKTTKHSVNHKIHSPGCNTLIFIIIDQRLRHEHRVQKQFDVIHQALLLHNLTNHLNWTPCSSQGMLPSPSIINIILQLALPVMTSDE